MANFTDNPQLLTNFNGYVQQYPVEAAVNVGTYKQGQFEAGISKVQGFVDSLYSLPIDKDDVKSYVSAKVNQLRTGIKGSIAGDFSDQRLINQIGGYVKDIYSDPIIQNGIASSAAIRAGQAQIELDRKEGKLQPQNEWDFSTQASKYLSDGDVKSSFNYKYTPYQDYKKKALETLKSLSGDESITDEAFTVDSSGNLTITDAITREKFKNLSPEKIRTALLAVFTPGDLQQISIDGKYNYSNKSPQELLDNIIDNNNSTITAYTEKINQLGTKLSSTNDVATKQGIEAKIEDYNKAIKSIQDRTKIYGDMLDQGNFEGVAAQLQSDSFFDTFSKAFSYTEVSKTYETSPFATMQFNRDKEANDWKRFQLGLENDNFWKRMEYDQKEKEIALKKKEVEGSFGSVPYDIDPNAAFTPTLDKFVETVKQSEQDLITKKSQLFTAQESTGGSITNEEALDGARELWLKGQLTDPTLKEYFDNEASSLNQITTANKVIKDVEEKVRRENPNLANISELTKGITGIDYIELNPDRSVKNKYNFTAKDIAEFQNILPNYRQSAGGTGGYAIYDTRRADAELSPKQRKLLNIWAKADQGKLTDAEKNVFNKVQEVIEKVTNKYTTEIKNIADLQKVELSKRLSTTQGKTDQFPVGKAEQRAEVRGIFQDFFNKSKAAKSVDKSDFTDLVGDPEATYSMNTIEGTTYTDPVTTLTVSKGDKNISFDISESDRKSVFGNFGKGTPYDRAFQPIEERINLTGGYTTNAGKGDPNFSMFKQNDFGNVSLYGVTADVEKSPGGGYVINFNYFDPVKKKWIADKYTATGFPMQKEQVVTALQSISDEFIYNRINGNQPLTQAEAEKLKAAKKDNY